MNIEDYNFHWHMGYKYGFPIKREIYSKVYGSLDRRWITVLTGGRRTGKTTMMKQMIDDLIHKGVEPENILYFSFEDGERIIDVFREYERILGKDIAFSKKRYYLFFDEVQKVKDWAQQIKYLYDHYKNLKIAVSGSSSLYIRQGRVESLAGRTMDFTLGPLSFREYLVFSGKGNEINKWRHFKGDLEREYERYILRSYIECVKEDEDTIAEYSKGIVEKVVYIDIPEIFDVGNPHIVMKIMDIVSSMPGMLLDYASVGESIGNGVTINRMTASKYIHILENAYLLKLLYNYSPSPMVSERRAKKVYPMAGSLCLMHEKPPLPKIVEQNIVLTTNTRFFWRSATKQEVDAVALNNQGPIPIEVKYKTGIKKDDIRGVVSFMKRFKSPYGIIISKDVEEFQGSKNIYIIPAWWFALKDLHGVVSIFH